MSSTSNLCVTVQRNTQEGECSSDVAQAYYEAFSAGEDSQLTKWERLQKKGVMQQDQVQRMSNFYSL